LKSIEDSLTKSVADSAGWVDVDKATTQHNKYKNVFSIGDASSLPNSKTAAAITSQVPVLVDNLLALINGKSLDAAYDGYASCPLLTGHGELMLCEFKYGGVPKETFAPIFGGQETPSRLYYHLKKDLFVSVYFICRNL
jgi:eukaryotic sulfide quinone oxidoreductase